MHNGLGDEGEMLWEPCAAKETITQPQRGTASLSARFTEGTNVFISKSLGFVDGRSS